MAGAQASSIGDERDPVSYALADWHRVEDLAREHRCARLARSLINLAQSGAKIARCDVNGILLFVYVLKDCNEGGIGCGAGSIQL